MELHWDILDERRRAILPLFKEIGDFYLAGGTALALHFGHRDSIDFDFFMQGTFDAGRLFERVRDIFVGHSVLKTQEETGALSILVDKDIRVSFLHFPYPLLEPIVETPYFPIASIEDIACMKLNAVVNRSEFKDYVDLYFILKDHSLTHILDVLKKKMPSLDPLLALKSLAFLDDVQEDPILFKAGSVSLAEIKTFFANLIAKYPKNL